MTQKEICLIDAPGYFDSHGCHRVLSNGYFHYQVFSKIQNIKFVLVVGYNDLKEQAMDFRLTFKNFIEGFEAKKFSEEK